MSFMQLTVYPPLRPALDLALAISRSGGVVVYPTDTVYGVGGDATNGAVVQKIIFLKARPTNQPMTVLFSDWAMAQEYVKMDDKLRQLLEELTPGPYTFLLPLLKPLPVTSSLVVGCRVPSHEFCQAWAKALGKPIITTSANHHQAPAARSIEELDEEIANGVDLIVDGGPSLSGIGSTIIDVTKKKILRPGAGLEKATSWLKKL